MPAKKNKMKFMVIGSSLEDKEGFQQLLARTHVEAVMSMCPKEIRMKVLDNALKILKGTAVTK